jgi:ketosteroid isomerase-like protein
MNQLFLVFFLHLSLVSLQAAETPETLLIRRVLDNNKFGIRRGDAELALSGFAEKLVVYDAHQSPAPQAWTIEHESLDLFAAELETDLKARRYAVDRLVPIITVRGDKAIATTIDSGQVIDRASGTAMPFIMKRFWIFQKTENEWLAHALVNAWNDSSTAAAPATSTDADVAAVLEDERAAWEDGSSGSIVSLFDEKFTGYDGTQSQAPAQWAILFNNSDELATWLEKRLNDTTYKINRQLLFARVGSDGNEAVAMTQEDLSTSYTRGPVTHNLKRQILWTLSKQTGRWKITNMVLNFGSPE